jgi:hypothetical protein
MKPPPNPAFDSERPGSAPDRPRGSWLSIFFVGVLGFATFAALAVLTLGIMPQVVILGVAMLAFAGINYLIWGWWLPKVLPKPDDEDEPSETSGAEHRR